MPPDDAQDINLALLARQRGRREEAIAAYREAIDSGVEEAQIALDLLLLVRGREGGSVAGGVASIRTAVTRQPGMRAASRAMWTASRVGPRLVGRLERKRRSKAGD